MSKKISSHLLDAFLIEGDIVIQIVITRLFEHFYKQIMDIKDIASLETLIKKMPFNCFKDTNLHQFLDIYSKRIRGSTD